MNEPLELIIADPDPMYLDRLAAYVRHTGWADRLRVHWCTRQITLQKACESKSVRLIASHRDWLPLEPDCRWVALEDRPLEGDAPHTISRGRGGKDARLFKYQPIERLLSAMIGLADATSSGIGPSAANPTAVMAISLIAASGGTGKTTTAYQLAHSLASRGRRCLLVGLESIGSFAESQPPDTQIFGQYLYFSRNGSAKAGEELNKLIRRQAGSPLDLLPCIGALREMEELTADDVRRLIGHLREGGGYRYLVLDPDSGSGAAVRGSFAASDRVLCMVGEGELSIRKTVRFLHDLPSWQEMEAETLRSKLSLVYNRWSGDPGPEHPIAGAALAGKLPVVSGWKRSAAWEHSPQDPVYERQLLELADRLEGKDPHAGHASIA